MQELHQPTHRQALFFLLFTLALAVAVFAWVFFLNKGTLTVSGEAPFAIFAGGSKMECANSPCSIQLKPQKYSVTLHKDGFYDDVRDVEISRAAETPIAAQFGFIPVVREMSGAVLTVPNAPLRPPFIGTKKPENFPRAATAAAFSGSGTLALVTIGKELYSYNVVSHEVSRSDFKPGQNFAWLGEDIVVLDNAEKGQVLKVFHGTDAPKVIATFERAFENPVMSGSVFGNYILIADDGGGGNFSYYVVNVLKKTRQRMPIPASATNVHFADDFIVFEDGAEATKKVSLVNPETGATSELSALDSENVVGFAPDIILYISTHKAEEKESSGGLSIGEAIDEVKKETFSGSLSGQYFIISKNIKTVEARTIAEIGLKEGESVHRLTADADLKNLYFELMAGGASKIFAVQLEKE